MFLRPILISVFVLQQVCCNTSFCQENVLDSLTRALNYTSNGIDRVNTLNELCYEYAYEDLEKSIEYGNMAYALSEKLNYGKGLFISSRYLGRAYSFQDDMEEAVRLLERCVEIGDQYPIENRDMALAHNDLGMYYFELSKYEDALVNYYEAIRYTDLDENRYVREIVILNICNVYFLLEDFEKAIDLAEEALSFFKEENEEYYVGIAYTELGHGYENLGNYDLALGYYLKALDIFNKFEALDQQSIVLNSLGTLNQHMEKWDKALQFYNESLIIDLELEDYGNISTSYANIAGIFVELGRLDTAIVLLDMALDIAKDHSHTQMLMKTYLYAADACYLGGDFEKSYDYRLQYDELKDSIFSEEKRKEIIEIQEKYGAEAREKEIQYLEAEREKISTQAKLTNSYLISGIVFLLLVIFILALYFKNRKSRELRERVEVEKSLISLKSTALMAQLNPHLVFNVLNSIQGLVSDEQIENANIYISKFSKFMRKSLTMSKNNTVGIEEELKITLQYFELEKLRFSNKISLEIDNQLNDLAYLVPPLILQPLIENSLKYGILPSGREGRITITLKEGQGRMVITVEDDGIGFKSAEINGKGDGLRISEERLQIMNPANSLRILNLKDPTVIQLIIVK